jgi:nucleoside-diphosphate-sugar epimerase
MDETLQTHVTSPLTATGTGDPLSFRLTRSLRVMVEIMPARTRGRHTAAIKPRIAMKRRFDHRADGLSGNYIVSALEKDFNIHPVRENIFHIDWEKRITDSNPEYLIHLAWETKEGYLDSPNNLLFVMKSIEMYNAFFRHGGRRAVFIGTEQEYRRSDLPLKEDSPLKPESLYAECKAGLGSMLVKDSLLRGYGFVWCRLFFVYGFGEKPKRLVPA